VFLTFPKAGQRLGAVASLAGPCTACALTGQAARCDLHAVVGDPLPPGACLPRLFGSTYDVVLPTWYTFAFSWSRRLKLPLWHFFAARPVLLSQEDRRSVECISGVFAPEPYDDIPRSDGGRPIRHGRRWGARMARAVDFRAVSAAREPDREVVLFGGRECCQWPGEQYRLSTLELAGGPV